MHSSFLLHHLPSIIMYITRGLSVGFYPFACLHFIKIAQERGLELIFILFSPFCIWTGSQWLLSRWAMKARTSCIFESGTKQQSLFTEWREYWWKTRLYTAVIYRDRKMPKKPKNCSRDLSGPKVQNSYLFEC